MTGSDNAVNNLAFGLSIAANAQIDADDANRRALEANQRALNAEIAAARKTTDRDLERKLKQANTSELLAKSAYQVVSEELAEAQALINEWMHSNEACKRLAQKYSKKLGIAPEELSQDFKDEVINLSEENPVFAKTRLVTRAKNLPPKN